jgi:hypothetical protein
MTPALFNMTICSSVAPRNRKPEAQRSWREKKVSDMFQKQGKEHTKGVKYWKLFGSERAGLSFKMNEISITRTRPAPMRVYPKIEWTIVLIINSWV